MAFGVPHKSLSKRNLESNLDLLKSAILLCMLPLTGKACSQHLGYQILAASMTLVSIQWSEHHYISFKWHGPVKLEGIFTEPSRLVSQQSTRTRAPACPRRRAESRLRRRWWVLHFWKSTVLNIGMQRVHASYNSGASKIHCKMLVFVFYCRIVEWESVRQQGDKHDKTLTERASQR